MSATNRGSERIKNDNYPTPAWCVKRLLEVWQPKNNLLLEPCVGDGVIVSAINKYLSHNHSWISYDIRPNTYTPTANSCHFVQDFLTVNTLPIDLLKPCPGYLPISAVITNPPFSLLNEFLYHSRKLCPEADLIYLLRLNTLAGGPISGRDKLYKDLGTPDIYVLPNRPSFVKGKTDACEYAWFIFPPEVRLEGTVRILNQTPKKERT
jgi:hypothetical protein